MFGTFLKLDCARQNRVDPNGFMKLFKEESQAKIKKLDTKAPATQASLNSSVCPNFHEPTPVRQTLYPTYFDATMLRTLYYNIRIHGDLPKMTRVFINKDQSVVFEFEESVRKETAERLHEILKSLGRVEFTNPEISGKRVGFDIETDSYTEPRSDVDE